MEASSAADWWRRVRHALDARSFEGVLLVSQGSSVSSARLAHYCDGRERVARLEALDGVPRLQMRHNDQVVTLWPSSRVALFESQDPVREFPALPQGPTAGLLQHYRLRRLGPDRIAGMDAEVVQVSPQDGWRHGQRLWAEPRSGLLLRADILGPQGELLESSAFSELRWAPRLRPEGLLAPLQRLEGYRVVRLPGTATQLKDEGWRLGELPPGFELVHVSRRPLDALHAAQAPSVLQAVFSDGLAQVSVFAERLDSQRHRQPLRSQRGATRSLASARGDTWLTVMGEVPAVTVERLDAAFGRVG